MLPFSQQHKIVSDVALSFSLHEKKNTRVSPKIVSRDRAFLSESKYVTKPEQDFRFLVMWTVFKRRTHKIDTLKILQQYTPEDLKYINQEKEKIVLYMNTIEKDFETCGSKILTPKTVLDMYNKKLISCLYVWWYFREDFDLTRIQKRSVQNVQFFIHYFPVIEKYLSNVRPKKEKYA